MENARFLEMWSEIREVFDTTIKKYDALWIKRERKIDTRFLILFILRLTIPKDERGYANTLLEIFNNFFNFGVIDGIMSLAPSSICEARTKLDPIIFKELNNGIIDVWNRFNEKPLLWNGLLLRGVDGSKLNLPKELMSAGYKTPGNHSYYPQGLLSGVYDLLTGIPLDFDFLNHCNERACVLSHLEKAEKGSLYVYDRGYFSFEVLEDHIKDNIHAIFRLKSNTGYKEISDFWESAEIDTIVILSPPKKVQQDVKKEISNTNLEPIPVRLIKYTIEEKTYVLLSTLTDQKKYPTNVFPGVYHSRWGHEEMLKVSKEITGVKDFHSLSEIGVKQELFAHFLIITLLKIVQSQSHCKVQEQKTIKDEEPPKRRIIPLEKKTVDKSSSKKLCLNEPVENIHVGIKGILNTGKDLFNTCLDKIFKKNEEIDQFYSEDLGIQVNQRGCFLMVSSVLEKMLFWDPIKFIKENINHVVDLTKRIYQKVRPGRSYPRISKKPASKWVKKKKVSSPLKA